MKLFSTVTHFKGLTNADEVTFVCWEKELTVYEEQLKVVNAYEFRADQYGAGRYIQNSKKPSLYDEDWEVENGSKQYVLIGSASSFRTLESLCGELTQYINKLLAVLDKCEIEPDQWDEKIKGVMERHAKIKARLLYSDRYVVG